MQEDPPNILLITSDQQHYDTLGVTNSRIKTPALDRLAAEGTRFTRAYCPNPTCTPTRASMYDPAEMVPGRVAPNEHDQNPAHFGLTQEEKPRGPVADAAGSDRAGGARGDDRREPAGVVDVR